MKSVKKIGVVIPVLLGFLLLPYPALSETKDPFEELDPSVTNSKPFQRAYWEFYQRAFPLGYIPKGAKGRAAKQIEEFKAKKSSSLPFLDALSETAALSG